MWSIFLATLIATDGGTRAEFAQALGISRTHLSHLLSGQYVPGLELCLTIARVTKTPASKVLREAGKGELAALLEQLYGGPAQVRTTDPAITAADRRLLLQIHGLDARTQRAIRYLVEALTRPAR
jgi:DNA-binding XRE family transcriptional regulator